MISMDGLIYRKDAIDALHTWFRDGFDEDKWWNSTHVLAAIEGLPSVQQEHKWETCFECPLSHGCPKIKGCTNEQTIEYASQIPNDCPLSAQPELIRINLNESIKVKLTDWGKEIYYHKYDRVNQIAGREICKPKFPKEDEKGYTIFQLWCFIELYGEHIGMAMPNVIEPLEIVYER